MTGNTKSGLMAGARAGFTLIEVLISTAIISIVMVVAVQLFFIYYQSADRTYQILTMESEGRRIMNQIAGRVRESRIDYDYYATTPDAEPALLALRDGDGIQSVYWIFDSGTDIDLYLCSGKGLDDSCSHPLTPVGDPDWEAVNAEGVRLTSGQFNVTPTTDPLFPTTALAPASNLAPFVRIRFRFATGSGSDQVDSSFFQTGIAPRLYVR